jgi:hypothetical protein
MRFINAALSSGWAGSACLLGTRNRLEKATFYCAPPIPLNCCVSLKHTAHIADDLYGRR